MFLPTTQKECAELGWDPLDIILVTGDTYIDSPYSGVAVIGKLLVCQGYRVGIIAQPDPGSGSDITRLGEPYLFWGISSGCVDSMVANYTASKKKRKQDDYTPGGENRRRPDRAVIVYANLVRQYFKKTAPIVLGGIEASLRRISHYDFWSDHIRRSILFDAKADYLVYGMAEKTIVGLAHALKNGQNPEDLPGLCYASATPPAGFVKLPSFKTVLQDKQAFIESFRRFYDAMDPLASVGIVQQQDSRFLVQTPPQHALSMAEMDRIYDLDFERGVHPYYAKEGPVRALDTIRFSLTTHRGCYGECHFCAIALHEGRQVQWRSRESIVREAGKIASHPLFKGVINDVGGPTANMYGFECYKKITHGACQDKRCLYPDVCPSLKPDHSGQIRLLHEIKKIPGVKKVFIGSGIRHDLVLSDTRHGMDYLACITRDHVSGQLKLAPEHSQTQVLAFMGKPDITSLLEFKKQFDQLSKKAGKNQFLTYYFIAAHPGCTLEEMKQLKMFTRKYLKIAPEQVQIFTPTPSTYSTLMYYTGIDPFTGKSVYVEKNLPRKEKQKSMVTAKSRRK